MNWHMWIRQFHRWTSIAFVAAMIVNVVAPMRQEQAVWVGVLALLPLVLLMLTGLYLFVLSYVAGLRGTTLTKRG